ncbi:MAG: hypothetical protein CVU44_14515 [Chloroflexi bacterium HGW-Chloroflexi-6]|nr:MAG: hypothetical protein CVU44_14515 [Chloroflexi bacterium HGW-Chloroflexi-6]
MKLLYICGITPDYPALLRPLPPLDSGAPHGNIFRLVEFLAQYHWDEIEIVIISAMSPGQQSFMQASWPSTSVFGEYRHVIIPDGWRKLSSWLNKNIPFLSGVLRRLFGAYSLQGWYYFRQIQNIYRDWQPNWVILDDAPQYIPTLLRFVPREKVSFYCRYDIGSSRRFLHWPSRVLVSNEAMGDWVKKINQQVLKCEIVHNTLPIEFSHRDFNPDRFHATSKTILFVGRITPQKGIQHLIPAFVKIRAVEPLARLVIVGAENPASLGNQKNSLSAFELEMRQLAQQFLPSDSVIWRGWLSHEELIAQYGLAYLAVYPSVYMESFGNVALEAMASGLPVVASDRPGFRSLLEKGGGMLVSDPTNEVQLAQVILRLLQDPDLAENLGYQAFQVAQQYTVNRAATEFLSVLKIEQ